MNQLIADNKVSTLRSYLVSKLEGVYSAREAGNLVQLLFETFNRWTRSELVLNAEQRLGESELLRYHFALKRLLQGEPIQYVLGYTWFLDLRIATTPAALIPRPETEELVRLTVERNKAAAPRILDIGTGTGCIAIALQKLLPEAAITAIDVSPEALDLATNNAKTHEAPIAFKQLDFLHETPEGVFDLVVSNPPYIPLSEATTMEQRVTEHEPHIALFTEDADALIFYRRMMELTPTFLSDNGIVLCEIHESMADALMQLAQSFNLSSPEIHIDMQGKNRMMTWRK
jgi:release factor glutamine methyltransferase